MKKGEVLKGRINRRDTERIQRGYREDIERIQREYREDIEGNEYVG